MKKNILRSALPTVISNGGIRYLLRDDFTDTLAAGSVDGTSATPGPGTRAAVDTNSKQTIGSGYLNMATGAAGNDGFWLDAVTRTPGRVICWLVNSTSGNILGVGISNASKTDGAGQEMRIYSSILNYTRTSAVTVGAYTSNSDYKLACVLLSTGVYWFIRGGVEYPHWTFLCYERVYTVDPVYPYIVTQSTTAVYKAGLLRVPNRLWLPTPLAYDAFTRDNGSLGNTITTGPDGQAVASEAWSGDTWTISSNAAINTPNYGAEQATGNLTVGTWYKITATEVDHFYSGCAVGNTFRAEAATALDASNKVQALTLTELFATLELSTSNVAIQVKCANLTAGTQAGIVLRLDDPETPTSFALVYWDGQGNIKHVTYSGGTYTLRVNSVKAFTAGDSILVVYGGATPKLKKLHINAAGTISFLNHTLNPAAAATIHGIFSTDPTNTITLTSIFPVGEEGQFSALDNFFQ